MNAADCEGFTNAGGFLETAKAYKQQPQGCFTYLVVCNRQIPRLRGSSDILYIGQTKKLGGQDGRLWNYCYAIAKNPTEYRVRERAKDLVAQGDKVSFFICPTPPNGWMVKQYESELLRRYRADHWDGPPLNAAG